jgi:hypothetical protein
MLDLSFRPGWRAYSSPLRLPVAGIRKLLRFRRCSTMVNARNMTTTKTSTIATLLLPVGTRIEG